MQPVNTARLSVSVFTSAFISVVMRSNPLRVLNATLPKSFLIFNIHILVGGCRCFIKSQVGFVRLSGSDGVLTSL